VVIIPKDCSVNELIQFLPISLLKDFKLGFYLIKGDKVILTEGSNKGESATIIKLEDKIASLMLTNLS
jgi:hypothetical protein